jgi:hypothetical protein
MLKAARSMKSPIERNVVRRHVDILADLPSRKEAASPEVFVEQVRELVDRVQEPTRHFIRRKHPRMSIWVWLARALQRAHAISHNRP